MTDLYGIALRQPQAWDVAALGTAFEAGYGWVIRAPDAVARATGSTVAKIAAASRLRDPNRIQVGQVLRVPL